MATASTPRTKSRRKSRKLPFTIRDINGYIRVRNAITPIIELPDEGHWQIVEEGTGRVLKECGDSHTAAAFANATNRLKDPGELMCYAVEVQVVRMPEGRVVRPARRKGGAA